MQEVVKLVGCPTLQIRNAASVNPSSKTGIRMAEAICGNQRRHVGVPWSVSSEMPILTYAGKSAEDTRASADSPLSNIR
jgi:hypothetical protein